MEQLKVSSTQFDRLSPGQRTAKERDEGFVSSTSDRERNNHHVSETQTKAMQPEQAEQVDNKSNLLLEHRQQDLAKQVDGKERTQQEVERAAELSAQRQIESRAAANKEKIKNSYNAVQESENRQRSEEMHHREVSEKQKNSQTSSTTEPINFVV